METKLESKLHHGLTNLRSEAASGMLRSYAPSYFAPAVPEALNAQDGLANNGPRLFTSSC